MERSVSRKGGKGVKMCKVVDLSDRRIKEKEIHWTLNIGTDVSPESFSINSVCGTIHIILTLKSFDGIQLMREKALIELKNQIAKNTVRCLM